MADPFVGRETVLGELRALLAEARAGRPRVALLDGPAGIGKTALIAAFRDELEGDVVVLHASGEETERALTYGVVDQLLDAARLHNAEMPELQDKLEATDPLTVGARALAVFGALQSSGPLLIVVDDTHWADTPSLHALVFALRRLRVDHVLVIFATRDDAVPALPPPLQRMFASEQGTQIHLGPLDEADLSALAEHMGIGALAPSAAQRLHAQTGGNPLHARAVLEEVPVDVLNTSTEAPLPAPKTFAAMALTRLGSCSPSAQDLVAAASVLGGRFPLTVAGAVAGIDDAGAAMQEAVDARLLAFDLGDRVASFHHPLVRSAVYYDLQPARRSALHAQAAEVLGDDEAASLRHRAAAALDRDEPLASALDAMAENEAGDGHWSAAAADLMRAAELSPEPLEREGRILRALDCWVLGADFGELFPYVAEVDDFTDTAWRRYIQGVVALMSGRMADAEQLLRLAWDMTDPTDDALRPRIAAQISVLGVALGWGEESIEWARRAKGAPGPIVPTTAQMFGLALVGRAPEGLEVAAALSRPLPHPTAEQLDPLTGRGTLRLWTGDLHGAVADLSAVVAACKERGPFFLDIVAVMYLAHAEFRLGDWNMSVVHGGLAASGATDADLIFVGATTNAVASLPLSARGDFEAAAMYVAASRQGADATGDVPSTLFASVAAAELAIAQRDWDGVVAAIEPHMPNVERTGGDEPNIMSWREPLAEALVRLGRLDEAEDVVAKLERRGEERGVAFVQAGAARVRGLLQAARGSTEEAVTSFTTSLELATAAHTPFAAALVHLNQGEMLRRTGKRRAAANELNEARRVLEALGARPYVDRCDQELAACGLKQTPRSGDAPRLTPQEQAVAHLVAAGGTNREVAAELVLSVKTVEYHLANIFTSLGVSSRRQLGGRLAEFSRN